MTVRLYQSTDSGAPVLYGAVGSLTALLRAVLVTGYGGSPPSTPGAGWTEPFTQTSNQTAFRMQTSGGTGFYLAINDNGPGAAGAKEARAWGYESMSGYATGTNPFPTASQLASGCVIRKSFTADGSNARAWTILASEHFFAMFILGDYTAPNPFQRSSFCFGDIISYKPTTDDYRCIIIGKNHENDLDGNYEGFGQLGSTQGGTACVMIGHFMARRSNGLGTSVACTKLMFSQWASSNYGYAQISGTQAANAQGTVSMAVGRAPGLFANPFPQPTSGGVTLGRMFVAHDQCNIRGHLPGLWMPLHDLPLNDGDTFGGGGNLDGRSFLAQNILCYTGGVAAQVGQVVLETSNTWD